MRKILWGALALSEIAIAFYLAFHVAYPAVFNLIRLARTRNAILWADGAYFSGMLFGDFLRIAPACFFMGHAIWATGHFQHPPTSAVGANEPRHGRAHANHLEQNQGCVGDRSLEEAGSGIDQTDGSGGGQHSSEIPPLGQAYPDHQVIGRNAIPQSVIMYKYLYIK
jgi:hypothetical protein